MLKTKKTISRNYLVNSVWKYSNGYIKILSSTSPYKVEYFQESNKIIGPYTLTAQTLDIMKLTKVDSSEWAFVELIGERLVL